MSILDQAKVKVGDLQVSSIVLAGDQFQIDDQLNSDSKFPIANSTVTERFEEQAASISQTKSKLDSLSTDLSNRIKTIEESLQNSVDSLNAKVESLEGAVSQLETNVEPDSYSITDNFSNIYAAGIPGGENITAITNTTTRLNAVVNVTDNRSLSVISSVAPDPSELVPVWAYEDGEQDKDMLKKSELIAEWKKNSTSTPISVFAPKPPSINLAPALTSGVSIATWHKDGEEKTLYAPSPEYYSRLIVEQNGFISSLLDKSDSTTPIAHWMYRDEYGVAHVSETILAPKPIKPEILIEKKYNAEGSAVNPVVLAEYMLNDGALSTIEAPSYQLSSLYPDDGIRDLSAVPIALWTYDDISVEISAPVPHDYTISALYGPDIKVFSLSDGTILTLEQKHRLQQLMENEDVELSVITETDTMPIAHWIKDGNVISTIYIPNPLQNKPSETEPPDVPEYEYEDKLISQGGSQDGKILIGILHKNATDTTPADSWNVYAPAGDGSVITIISGDCSCDVSAVYKQPVPAKNIPPAEYLAQWTNGKKTEDIYAPSYVLSSTLSDDDFDETANAANRQATIAVWKKTGDTEVSVDVPIPFTLTASFDENDDNLYEIAKISYALKQFQGENALTTLYGKASSLSSTYDPTKLGTYNEDGVLTSVENLAEWHSAKDPATSVMIAAPQYELSAKYQPTDDNLDKYQEIAVWRKTGEKPVSLYVEKPENSSESTSISCRCELSANGSIADVAKPKIDNVEYSVSSLAVAKWYNPDCQNEDLDKEQLIQVPGYTIVPAPGYTTSDANNNSNLVRIASFITTDAQNIQAGVETAEGAINIYAPAPGSGSGSGQTTTCDCNYAQSNFSGGTLTDTISVGTWTKDNQSTTISVPDYQLSVPTAQSLEDNAIVIGKFQSTVHPDVILSVDASLIESSTPGNVVTTENITNTLSSELSGQTTTVNVVTSATYDTTSHQFKLILTPLKFTNGLLTNVGSQLTSDTPVFTATPHVTEVQNTNL